jgi:hypothetical protein
MRAGNKVMLVIPNPDGSASVVLHGDLVKVSPHDMGKALAVLLEEIARLELRVIELEKARKDPL